MVPFRLSTDLIISYLTNLSLMIYPVPKKGLMLSQEILFRADKSTWFHLTHVVLYKEVSVDFIFYKNFRSETNVIWH